MSSSAGGPASPCIGPGRVVLIVGPSGSGKDTLLRLARAMLTNAPGIVFPARIVTRASSLPEEEAAATPEDFAAAESSGRYALVWHAHGLAYAIPSDIDADVLAGRTVVLNGSRTILAKARARYADVAVVLIDAPTEVRAARLSSRGREGAAEVTERLSRIPAGFATGDADLVITNTGEASVGAGILARFIRGGPGNAMTGV